ncbi:FecR domain-containing protein [Herbaspirillum autotrophicum]|uniref:FecR domain-containing protein n=1 Tax=Herbaspirillum autotrophicum TaxID=180195 RepID=UPI00067CEF0F|nr:FecR family protein [Herbaspirillum autotrophicum]
MTTTVAIDPDVLEQAAEWLMLLNASNTTDEQRRACRHWQNACPEHARAWARAELLMNKLGGLPPSLAMPVLERPSAASRRRAVLKLASVLAALPAAWLGWRVAGQQGWRAEHRTATGERRQITLADGSTIFLNTGTAIDIAYDATERLIRLRSGEIVVTTAHDTAAAARPFYVETAEGRMQALGTRFSVRQDDGRTRLAVFESAVRIEPRKMPASHFHILQAGQKTGFSAFAIDAITASERSDEAWTGGVLLVDKMPLAEFAGELTRYRRGFIHCDPAVAGLLVSGTFPLDDPDRILTMLVSTYPVRAVTRFNGYWLTLTLRT